MSKLGYYILTFFCGATGILALLTLVPAWDSSNYGATYRTAQIAELSMQLFLVVPIAILCLMLALYFGRQARRGSRW